jgi:hypothetical protein
MTIYNCERGGECSYFCTMKGILFFLVLCALPVNSTQSFAQNNQDVSNLLPKRIKSYKDIGLKLIFVDSEFNDEGTRLRVEKGKKIIFDGNFIRISGNPDVFKFDSLKAVFLFTLWSNGAHCCRTIITAIYDGVSFRFADTLFLSDGYYKLKDLDSDGVKEILADIDRFPYRWTSFSGSDYDLTILKIDSVTGKLTDVTAKYPDRVMKYVRSYQKAIRASNRDTLYDAQRRSNIAKQELACLLYAYISLGKEAEGWEILRKQYPYKDSKEYFKELKEIIAKGPYKFF